MKNFLFLLSTACVLIVAFHPFTVMAQARNGSGSAGRFAGNLYDRSSKIHIVFNGYFDLNTPSTATTEGNVTTHTFDEDPVAGTTLSVEYDFVKAFGIGAEMTDNGLNSLFAKYYFTEGLSAPYFSVKYQMRDFENTATEATIFDIGLNSIFLKIVLMNAGWQFNEFSMDGFLAGFLYVGFGVVF